MPNRIFLSITQTVGPSKRGGGEGRQEDWTWLCSASKHHPGARADFADLSCD